MIKKLFRVPINMLRSRINSVGYAKKFGVRMNGKVYIYGSSYEMFSTEPWLITLGDNVHITNNVRFITHDGGTLVLRHRNPSLEVTKPITVGDNVYIGVNSIIMPGVNIGNNCIIGAGSVVTKDIPEKSVYAGVPARYIKSIEEYYEKIQKESLNLGHLTSIEKEKALKKHFNVK